MKDVGALALKALLGVWVCVVIAFVINTIAVGGIALPSSATVQQGRYWVLNSQRFGTSYVEVDKATFDRSQLLLVGAVAGIPLVGLLMWVTRKRR